MNVFEQVTIVKQASVYYDGKVSSRKVIFTDGAYKTLGIMLAGEYEFSTEAPEIMEVLAGEAEVLLPGETQWQGVSAGDTFEVPANASFAIKVMQTLDYCCTYL